MNVIEARLLGYQILAFVDSGEIKRALELLEPVLARRTPFAKLDLIGDAIGAGSVESVNRLLDAISSRSTEGGWAVIGKALCEQLDRDLTGALDQCRKHIIHADIWYGADILGERVPGPALTTHFHQALTHLASWRQDQNVWVRRSLGVAVHFWAKRSRGVVEKAAHADELLTFLKPMFGEWEMAVVKGLGWGLKTLGKYYPDLVATWLAVEVLPNSPRYRVLVLRKALTFLSEEQRAQVLES
jgi:3-methyladenine DNA glycosylase AlkD